MRRRLGGTFSGQYVFPGGVVDSSDYAETRVTENPHILVMQHRKRFGSAEKAQGFWVAAIRETFEECGILVAYDANRDYLAGQVDVFAAERNALNDKRLGFNAFLAQQGLTLAIDQVAYMTRKITPTFVPKRFDTHFFLVSVPEAADGSPCQQELEQALWITPQAALDRSAHDLPMVHPTLMALRDLVKFDEVDAVMAFYRARWGQT